MVVVYQRPTTSSSDPALLLSPTSPPPRLLRSRRRHDDDQLAMTALLGEASVRSEEERAVDVARGGHGEKEEEGGHFRIRESVCHLGAEIYFIALSFYYKDGTTVGALK